MKRAGFCCSSKLLIKSLSSLLAAVLVLTGLPRQVLAQGLAAIGTTPSVSPALPTPFVATPATRPAQTTAGACAASPAATPWAYPDLGAPYTQCVRASTGGTISYQNLELEIPPGALAQDTQISVRPLAAQELGPFERNQTNVTPYQGGYRLGPIGMQFLAPVTLSLPVDTDALPKGHDAQHLQTLYFDKGTKSWVQVPKVAVKPGLIQSTTTHFTDFVAASISPPDAPGPKVFSGKDLAAVQAPDPLAGIDLMTPATPNSSGSANFVFPIRVAAGRNGQQPSLEIRYNSDARNGWLGVGWGLSIPSIEIATRFGVPRYDGEQEIVYSLNGADLAEVTESSKFFSGRSELESKRQDVQQYARRTEGSFERILRVGTSAPYRWEVHRQDGSVQYFGENAESRLSDPNESRDPEQRTRVARWYLSREVDRFGNIMRYDYRRDEGCLSKVRSLDASGDCEEYFTRIYPYRIEYSEHPGDGQRLRPYYSVYFENYETIRPDIVLNARTGFAVATRKLLAGVEVRYFVAHAPAYSTAGLIRRYALDYVDGDYGKSLLVTLGQQGPKEASKAQLKDPFGSSETFAEHRFAYNLKRGPDPQMGYAPFTPAQRSSDQADKAQPQPMPGLHPSMALSAGTSSEKSGGGFLGFTAFRADGRGMSGEHEVTQTMVDVHGDGLLDHVSSVSGLKRNINPHDSDRKFDRWFTKADPSADDWGRFEGDGALGSIENWGKGKNSSRSFKLGVNVPGMFGTSLSAGVTNGTALDDFMLADMNGDGVIDRVSTTEEDGKMGVSLGQPSGVFMPRGDWGRPPTSRHKIDKKFAEQLMKTRRIFEPVLRWTAPRGGRVRIDGAIQKIEEGGDGFNAQIETKKDDSSKVIWGYAFGAKEMDPCRPSSQEDRCGDGLEVEIEAGETIYFRLMGHYIGETERITDVEKDKISWQPSIDYLDESDGASGPDGSSQRSFDFAKDFRVTTTGALRWISTGKGSINVWPEGLKEATADDLRFTVIRENRQGEEIERKTQPIKSKAAEKISLRTVSLDVDPGDRVYAQLSSDLPVDPDKIQVKADLSFNSEDAQVESSMKALPVEHRLHKFLPHPRLEAFEEQRARFFVDFSEFSKPDLARCAVVLQAPGRLLYKFVPTLDESTVVVDEALSGPGPYFATVVTPDAKNAVAVVSNDEVPVNLRVLDPSYHDQDQAPVDHFSGGYRGWQYADFDGLVDFETALPWIEDFESLSEESPFLSALASQQGLGSNKDNSRWNMRGGAGISLNAWTLGESVQRLPEFADKEEGSLYIPVNAVQGSRTRNWDFSAGVIVGGASLGVGRSRPTFTLMDINGDGRADGLGEDGVSYNLGRYKGFAQERKMDLGFDPEFRLGKSQQLVAALGIDLGGALQMISKVSGAGRFERAGLSSFSKGTMYGFANTASQMMDINGDGLVDQVRRHGSRDFEVRLGLGYRFTKPVIWPAHRWTEFRPGRSGTLATMQSEMLAMGENLAPHTVAVSETHTENKGIDFNVIVKIGGGTGTTLTRSLVDLIDMNGDGLPDAVLKNPGDSFFQVQLNDGTGFLPVQRWEVPDWPQEVLAQDGLEVHGLHDVLGYSWSVTKSKSLGIGFCPGKLCLGGSGSTSNSTRGTQMALRDINGDGLVDHIYKPRNSDDLWVKLNQLGRSNLLGTVETPAGGSYRVDYAKRGNNAGEVRVHGELRGFDAPEARYVMRAQKVEDAMHLDQTLSEDPLTFYDYLYEVYDRVDRRSNGFGQVASYLDDGRGKTAIHTWDYHNEDVYRRGLLRSHVLSRLDVQGNEDWVSREDYSYPAPEKLTEEVAYVKLDRKRSIRRDPKSGREMSLLERYMYTDFGNGKTRIDSGDAHTDEDDRYSTWAYQVSASPYFVLPSHQTEYSLPKGPKGSQTIHREHKVTYDAKGKIDAYQQRLINGPSQDPRTMDGEWAMTFFKYGRFAELKKVTRPSDYEVEFGYDRQTQSYVEETRDSLGQFSSQFFDLRFGKVTHDEGVNRHYVEYAYDDYGRLSSVTGPFARAAGQKTLRFRYGSFPSFPLWAMVTRWDPSLPYVEGQDKVVQSSVLVDGLGRPLAERTQAHVNDDGLSWDGWITRNLTGYDVWGNPIRVYEPFFDPRRGDETDPHPLTTLPDPGPFYREFEYDVHGRKTRSSVKGRTHSFAYDIIERNGALREQATRIDPLNQTQLVRTDARGQVVSVIEFLGGKDAGRPVKSSYAYNPIGELVRVTDPAGYQSTATYDSRGDLIALETPDAGKTRYFYNLFGNRVAEQSAALANNEEKIEYIYDGPRLLEIDAPGEAEDVTYIYGTSEADKGITGGNTFGRVKAEASATGMRRYTYDGLGQMASVSSELYGAFSDHQVIERAKVRYTHDDLGNIQSKVVEGVCDEVFSYERDHGGWLSALRSSLESTDQASCQDARSYVRRAEYNVRGQPSRIRYGNGLEAWYRYDEETQQLKEQYLLLESNTSQESSPSHLAYSGQAYDYDALGRLTTIRRAGFDGIDAFYPGFHVPDKTQTFAYDELSRLTASEGTLDPVALGSQRQNYAFAQTFDLLGNVTSKTQRSWTGFDDATISALKHQSYAQQYDYLGSRPRAVTELRRRVGGGFRSTRRFGYDASGRRIQQREDGRTRRFTWTAKGQLAAVTQDDVELSRSWYDGQGTRRVHRSLVHGTSSLVSYPVDELTVVDGERTVHVFFGDERVASHRPRDSGYYGEISWFHQDYLGSTNFVSNKHAVVHSQVEYFPSGEPWYEHRDEAFQLRAPAFLFTGKEYERSTGLYAFGFRHYDPVVGQWLSPDPAMPDFFTTGLAGGVFEPRNLATYSYAWNNPVGAKDPDGLAVETPWDVWNVVLGATSLAVNLIQGNFEEAAVDAGGMIVDIVATGLPGVPGGAATANNARRAAQLGEDLLMTGQRVQRSISVAESRRSTGSGNASNALSAAKKRRTLEPGPFARESIPAVRGHDRNFTPAERSRVNEIGRKHGCHTCGRKNPGTKDGDFVLDHQPPNALSNGRPQELFPQCLHCSRVQGGEVNAQLKMQAQG